MQVRKTNDKQNSMMNESLKQMLIKHNARQLHANEKMKNIQNKKQSQKQKQ